MMGDTLEDFPPHNPDVKPNINHTKSNLACGDEASDHQALPGQYGEKHFISSTPVLLNLTVPGPQVCPPELELTKTIQSGPESGETFEETTGDSKESSASTQDIAPGGSTFPIVSNQKCNKDDVCEIYSASKDQFMSDSSTQQKFDKVSAASDQETSGCPVTTELVSSQDTMEILQGSESLPHTLGTTNNMFFAGDKLPVFGKDSSLGRRFMCVPDNGRKELTSIESDVKADGGESSTYLKSSQDMSVLPTTLSSHQLEGSQLNTVPQSASNYYNNGFEPATPELSTECVATNFDSMTSGQTDPTTNAKIEVQGILGKNNCNTLSGDTIQRTPETEFNISGTKATDAQYATLNKTLEKVEDQLVSVSASQQEEESTCETTSETTQNTTHSVEGSDPCNESESVSCDSETQQDTTSFASGQKSGRTDASKTRTINSEDQTETVTETRENSEDVSENSEHITEQMSKSLRTESKDEVSEGSITDSISGALTHTVTQSSLTTSKNGNTEKEVMSEDETSISLAHDKAEEQKIVPVFHWKLDKPKEIKDMTLVDEGIEWTFDNKLGEACKMCPSKVKEMKTEAPISTADENSVTDRTYSFSLQHKYSKHNETQLNYSDFQRNTIFPPRLAINKAREQFFQDTPPEGAGMPADASTFDITSTVGNRSKTMTDQSTGQMTLSEEDMTEISCVDESFSFNDSSKKQEPQHFGDTNMQEGMKKTSGDIFKKVSFSDVLVKTEKPKDVLINKEPNTEIKGILKSSGSKGFTKDDSPESSKLSMSEGQGYQHNPDTISPIDPDSLRSDSIELIKGRKRGLFAKIFGIGSKKPKKPSSKSSALVPVTVPPKKTGLFQRFFGKRRSSPGEGAIMQSNSKMDCKYVSIEVHQNFIELPTGIRMQMGDGTVGEAWMRRQQEQSKIVSHGGHIRRYESGGLPESEPINGAHGSGTKMPTAKSGSTLAIIQGDHKNTQRMGKSDKAAGGEPPLGTSQWPGYPWSNYPTTVTQQFTPSTDSMVPEPASTQTTLASNSGSSCVSQRASLCGGFGFESLDAMEHKQVQMGKLLQDIVHTSTPVKSKISPAEAPPPQTVKARIFELETVSRTKLMSKKPMWEDNSASSLGANSTSDALSGEENSQYSPASRMRAGRMEEMNHLLTPKQSILHMQRSVKGS